MGYVIAAYGVTIVALAGYAIQLLRERRRLSQTPAERPSPPAPGKPGDSG